MENRWLRAENLSTDDDCTIVLILKRKQKSSLPLHDTYSIMMRVDLHEWNREYPYAATALTGPFDVKGTVLASWGVDLGD